MNVRTICLAVLSGDTSTGYEIRKLVSDGLFSHFVDASYGSIYPALNKLENDGMVTSCEEQQEGKPNRKVYSITDLGRQEFLLALSQPAQKDIYKSQFLLLAVFAELMQPKDVKRAIDMQIEYLETELRILDSELKDMKLTAADWVGNYGCACLNQGLQYILENRAGLEAVAGTGLNNSSQTIAAE